MEQPRRRACITPTCTTCYTYLPTRKNKLSYLGTCVRGGARDVHKCIALHWAHRCAVPLQAILKRGAAERHEPERAKEAHVRLVYQRLNRTVGTDIIPMPMPGEHDLDTWYYRTEGEAGYGEKLMQLDYARYRGVIDVKQDVLCLDRPILRAEFRYLRKNNQESFWDLIRWERRARCRLGILVP